MIGKLLLLPYYLTLKIRNSLYKKGVKKSQGAEVPTICVGNITVGGTGKTPHTEMILRLLLESYEWGNKNLAVLSRGYRRKSRGFQQVPVTGSALMFGDEPVQIKKRFPQVTVAVDKDRIKGCDYLCHPQKLLNQRKRKSSCWDKDFPASDLIIMDDAFQYRKLKASMNIVLVDYNRPVFKDTLLPFGHLRDLPERVYDADIIIVTKCPYNLDNIEKIRCAEAMGFKDFQPSTCMGTAPNGRKQLIFFTKIVYGEFVPIFENTDPRYRYAKRIILFSGIATDTPLQDHLSDKYNIVKRFSFPDHHKYSWADFEKIGRSLRQIPTMAVVTTEKDAQRVLDYSGLKPELQEKMFMIPIQVDFFDPLEREVFRKRLLGVGQTVR